MPAVLVRIALQSGLPPVTTKAFDRTRPAVAIISIFNKVGAFALRTGMRDFDRDAPGEAFDVAADQAPPAQRFHLLEVSDELERIIGPLPDKIKSRP
jgi:hypothetical protein